MAATEPDHGRQRRAVTGGLVGLALLILANVVSLYGRWTATGDSSAYDLGVTGFQAVLTGLLLALWAGWGACLATGRVSRPTRTAPRCRAAGADGYPNYARRALSPTVSAAAHDPAA